MSGPSARRPMGAPVSCRSRSASSSRLPNSASTPRSRAAFSIARSSEAENGLAASSTSVPIVAVRPSLLRRLLAVRFGRYPSRSAAALTRAASAGTSLIEGLLVGRRETESSSVIVVSPLIRVTHSLLMTGFLHLDVFSHTRHAACEATLSRLGHIASQTSQSRSATFSREAFYSMDNSPMSVTPARARRYAHRRALAVTVAALCAAALAACSSSSSSSAPAAGSSGGASSASGQTVGVSLILKTLTNPYFVTMKSDAEAAAAKDNIHLTIAAGSSDGDTQTQITAIDNAISRGDKGILITTNGDAVNAALNQAKQAGQYVIAMGTTTNPSTV